MSLIKNQTFIFRAQILNMMKNTCFIIFLFQFISCKNPENKNKIQISNDPSKVDLNHIYSYVKADEKTYKYIEIINDNEFLTYKQSVRTNSGVITTTKGSVIRDGNKLYFKKIKGDGPDGIVEYKISLNSDSVILTDAKGIDFIQDDEMLFIKNLKATPSYSKIKVPKPKKIEDKKILALLKPRWSTKESELLATKPKVLLKEPFEKGSESYLFVVLGFKNATDCHACTGVNDVALLKFINGSYTLVDYLENADESGYGFYSEVANVDYFGHESIFVELVGCGGGMGFEGCLSTFIGNFDDKLITLTRFSTQLKTSVYGDNDNVNIEENITRDYKFVSNGSAYFDLVITENDLLKKRKKILTYKFNKSSRNYDVKN